MTQSGTSIPFYPGKITDVGEGIHRFVLQGEFGETQSAIAEMLYIMAYDGSEYIRRTDAKGFGFLEPYTGNTKTMQAWLDIVVEIWQYTDSEQWAVFYGGASAKSHILLCANRAQASEMWTNLCEQALEIFGDKREYRLV